MAAMAARRLLMLYPRAMHLRTQAWPDGEEESPVKVSRFFKSRTVREIIRYREGEFDATAAKHHELRLVMQVRELLARRPRGLMDMSEISTQNPRLAETVLEYPGIFNVLDYNGTRLTCLTAEAQSVLQQEESVKEESEENLVRVVRKILMLSGKQRLSLRRLGFLAMDLGLPNDLNAFVSRYPEFFQLSTTLDYTTWVSLGEWDPDLAVSFAEIEDRQRRAGNMMSQMEMWTPKGYVLSKRHRKVLARFREAPFVSPYADYRNLEPLKIKFEKHAVAGMQELLNLTLYKSLVLNNLAEFKTEFSFSNKPLDLLLRHPEYFYVSPVGKQETVFLRSAYSNGELARKSPLILIREQFTKLLDTKKQI